MPQTAARLSRSIPTSLLGLAATRTWSNCFDEFLAFKRPGKHNQPRQIIRDVAGQTIDPVADHSPHQIEQQLLELQAFQSRLDQLNVEPWNRSQQIDCLAVRSRLDQHEFVLRKTRPWARDPGFYVDQMLRRDLYRPAGAGARRRIRSWLAFGPFLYSSARRRNISMTWLPTMPTWPCSTCPIPTRVGHGYPYRANPPAGVLGWYDDLIARAEIQPELLDDIRAARNAVKGFEEWLRSQRPQWTAQAGVGEAAFDWYLKHVKLMPWTSQELIVLGQRELDRLWAVYALERHRNPRPF